MVDAFLLKIQLRSCDVKPQRAEPFSDTLSLRTPTTSHHTTLDIDRAARQHSTIDPSPHPERAIASRTTPPPPRSTSSSLIQAQRQPRLLLNRNSSNSKHVGGSRRDNSKLGSNATKPSTSHSPSARDLLRPTAARLPSQQDSANLSNPPPQPQRRPRVAASQVPIQHCEAILG